MIQIVQKLPKEVRKRCNVSKLSENLTANAVARKLCNLTYSPPVLYLLKIIFLANYHNGPSWVWPYGYFLLARDKFGLSIPDTLGAHCDHIFDSDWMGLPELQNENGSTCPGSCPIQSWSLSTLIEVQHKRKNKTQL